MQVYALTVMLLCGVFLGFLFDILAAYRFLRSKKSPLFHAGDFLFWIPVTALVFLALIYGNWGELRVYSLTGIVLGILLYRYLGSPLIGVILRRLFRVFFTVNKKATNAIRRLEDSMRKTVNRVARNAISKIPACRKRVSPGEDI
jgi:spore cortex biosynthesis protein YabQ